MIGKTGRVMRTRIFPILKRVSQLVAVFIVLTMAKVFHGGLFEGGIWAYRRWTDYSWLRILTEDAGGYFGDTVWILAIELFVYIPIALYWVFHKDLESLKGWIVEYRRKKEEVGLGHEN